MNSWHLNIKAPQDGYLGFSIFGLAVLKVLKIVFLLMSIKSTRFQIFKNPDDMLCKLVSAIVLYTYQKRRRYVHFWYPNNPKNDENYRCLYWNAFVGRCKLLRAWKYHHSIQYEKLKIAPDRHLSNLQETKLKFALTWPRMTWT